MNESSPGEVLVHVPVSSLYFVLVSRDPPLHGQVGLSSLELPGEELLVVLSLRLLLLPAHLLPVFGHPGRPLLVPPAGVLHHLRQPCLLLLGCQAFPSLHQAGAVTSNHRLPLW